MRIPFSNRIPLFYFFLVVFPFMAYWQIGWMQQVMKWDMLDQFFPYRYFLSECIHAGITPAWNPYQHLGWPFHADPQSGFWYPLAWLLALVRGYAIYTMNFEFILHIGIAGAGFFTLLRGFGIESKTALLFSFAYQCCGVFVNNAQHLTWIVALAWLPFVVHHYFQLLETKKGKHAVAAGFFMMLMLTGGYPIFSVITTYFFAVVFLLHIFSVVKERNWKALRNFVALNGLMYGIFVALSGGYLISFYHALPAISRGEGLTLEQALAGAFPLKALVSLVLPFAVAKNEGIFPSDLSMLNVYIGIVPLLCAGAGIFFWRIPKVRMFGIFGTICLLAALGEATPVREFLYHYFPAMDKFRFPSIFRTFFIFSILIVGALSLQNAVERWSAFRKYFLTTAIACALLVFGIHFFALEKAEHFVKFPSLLNVPEYLGYFERSNLYQRIAIQSLIQGVIFLLLAGVFLLVKNRARLIPALLCITLCDLFLSTQLNLPATAISEVKATAFQRELNALPQGFPVPARQTVLETPTYNKQFYPSWHNQNIFTRQPTHQGFNSFQLTEFANFYDSPQRDLLLNHPVIFSEPEAVIQLKKFEPGKVEAHIVATEETRLTMLQNHYPGWGATVDGMRTKWGKTPFPFLTITIPHGEHYVLMEYAPEYLIPALIISALTFLLTACVLGFICFRRASSPALDGMREAY